MSEHYHDVGDLRFLKEMGKVAPTEFQAWFNLDLIWAVALVITGFVALVV